MAQKLYCPMCKKLLIKNSDLVTDEEVVLDLNLVKTTEKKVKCIKCENCKRKIKYFINK